MEKITVLMSAYKGKKYIAEQIESILRQKHVDIELLIRVDGSPDDTYQYINEITVNDPRVKVYEGENLRSAKSFLRLLQDAAPNTFYAFSDQDDIWDEDKLCTALRYIKDRRSDQPNMYYSNLNVVDADLHLIRLFHPSGYHGEDKYNILIDNMAAGCTMVFNRKAAELAVRRLPDYCLMHDAWVHLVCAFFGSVYYDNHPHISYRQHEDNVVGASKLDLNTIIEKVKRLGNNSVQPRKMLAIDFLRCYRDILSIEEQRELYKLTSYQESFKNKLQLFFDRTIKAPNLRRDIVYRALILLNKA